MKRLSIFIFLALTAISNLCSQSIVYKHLWDRNKPEVQNRNAIYGGLTHQHQDFFDKPFSYTGVEAGILLKRTFLLSAYVSSFVSNLEVELSKSKNYFTLAQGGFVFGYIKNSQKVLHAGMLFNIGYFSLTGSDSEFTWLHADNPTIKISGIAVTPQVFAELNLLKWMKFRTGLGYSFYNFNDHSAISTNDLQHVSINFGFLFGKFSL